MSYFIIIDAGTTNLRVSLLDEAWQPLAQASDEAGVSHTAIDGNNGRLCNGIRTCVRQVMDSAGITAQDVRLCAAYGMITSDVGLMEIPHLAAPAGPAQFHAGLVTCEFPDLLPFPVTFIPGLKNTTEPVTLDRLCNVDMMRGEETEAIGLWTALRPNHDLMLVLPGSHNKFISVGRDGSLQGCMTSISGELLDVLTHHTVLSESLESAFVSPQDYDSSLMLAGAAACDAGLGRAAFLVRIMRTLGNFTASEARNFLLGAVMRMDLEALEHSSLFSPGHVLYIASKPPLGAALHDLLRDHGYEAVLIDESRRKSMGFLGVKTIWTSGLG